MTAKHPGGRPRRKPHEGRRVITLELADSELRPIDNWQFLHRYTSRTAAIRELLRRGRLYRPPKEETA